MNILRGSFAKLCLAGLGTAVLIACEQPIDQCAVPHDQSTQSVYSYSIGKISQPVADNFQKTGATVLLEQERLLSEGTEVVVIVDEICVSDKVLSEETLGEIVSELDIPIRERAQKKSPKQSYQYKLNSDMSIAGLENLVEADSCVLGVSESVVFKLNQSHLAAVKAAESHEIFYSQEGIQNEVVIAVIDSGIDLDHEDLKERLWVNQSEYEGVSGVDDDGNGYVDDVYGYNFASGMPSPEHQGTWFGVDHGTHVAGLAAAQGDNAIGVSGVMPSKALIMALNVFGSRSGASTANIDKAIRYAADNGAQVINMSLGGSGRTESTGSAIAYAISKGVTIVVAAGNSTTNIDSRFFTPASFAKEFDGMVAVGATDANDNSLCSFSNYGLEGVEIGAPGCDRLASNRGLYSTRGGNSYGFMAGTSMASPLVAGAAGLAVGFISSHSKDPILPKDIENHLVSSASVEPGLSNYIKGGAHLNLKALAEQLSGELPPVDPPVDPPEDPVDKPGEDPCIQVAEIRK